MVSNEYKLIGVLFIVICVVYLINKQVKKLNLKINELILDKSNKLEKEKGLQNNLLKIKDESKKVNSLMDNFNKIIDNQDKKVNASIKDILSLRDLNNTTIQRINYLFNQREKDHNLHVKIEKLINEENHSNNSSKKIIGKINNEETTFSVYQNGIKKINEEIKNLNEVCKLDPDSDKEVKFENIEDIDDSSESEPVIESFSDESEKIAIYSNDNEENNYSNSEIESIVSNSNDEKLESLGNTNEVENTIEIKSSNNSEISGKDLTKISEEIDLQSKESQENSDIDVEFTKNSESKNDDDNPNYQITDLMKRKLNELQCIAEENNIEISLTNGKKKTKKDLAIEINKFFTNKVKLNQI